MYKLHSQAACKQYRHCCCFFCTWLLAVGVSILVVCLTIVRWWPWTHACRVGEAAEPGPGIYTKHLKCEYCPTWLSSASALPVHTKRVSWTIKQRASCNPESTSMVHHVSDFCGQLGSGGTRGSRRRRRRGRRKCFRNIAVQRALRIKLWLACTLSLALVQWHRVAGRNNDYYKFS